MNVLLDTHVALWAITDSPRLSTKAREIILTPRAAIWISSASIWEIAIKHGLGREDMPVSGTLALGYFRAAGYQLLAIEPEHKRARVRSRIVAPPLPNHAYEKVRMRNLTLSGVLQTPLIEPGPFSHTTRARISLGIQLSLAPFLHHGHPL